jgi:hypothetical protein
MAVLYRDERLFILGWTIVVIGNPNDRPDFSVRWQPQANKEA